ncbi:MAG: Na(+)/H(+) antiporter subunit F [Planctomycetes bacterium ADurb.Bin126]|nr:MAG: Na(+)/H(+) antiporter subunit F [Planctomycetes bacterium ADurb.Bin126]HOD83577.1 cation:proton antiporter [Phycisphaerae bacterium]HQL74674.1 cation:proton antiporter [Phycisphaerae bacterium]
MTLFEQLAFGVLLLSSLLCLFRISRGPTAPDRAVAIDILGTLVVGFCCIMALWTGREFYVNIAIAWALISFVATLALAKYLEGRPYDA